MFITFEGPDGSGKSTQAQILKERLEKDGAKVKLVHFPRYESHIGSFIGKILKGEVRMPSFKAFQMLYVADQLDFQDELNKLLKDGYIVIADRYDMSTLAYYIAKTNCSLSEALGDIYFGWQERLKVPDLTYLFTFTGDIDKRRRGAGKEKDIIEKDESIIKNINETYFNLKTAMCSREFCMINGAFDKDKNSNIIYNKITKRNIKE